MDISDKSYPYPVRYRLPITDVESDKRGMSRWDAALAWFSVKQLRHGEDWIGSFWADTIKFKDEVYAKKFFNIFGI